MNTIRVEYPNDWKDYELIDTGDGEKLERFGTYTLVRPDPRALWRKKLPTNRWEEASATYRRLDPKSGLWDTKNPPPNPWHITYRSLTFVLRPTEFKHVGIFPEQAVNWDWLTRVINGRPIKVLNLFAYTGGATMAAVQAGAEVTHVDAVKSAIDWANENIRVSRLLGKPIRWIEEDAYKYVLREGRRGNTYDGIILDPPRFGRGTKGEVWKLATDLPKLLTVCAGILSSHPVFMLLNAYTADLSSLALSNMVSSALSHHKGEVQFGELALKESGSERLLPNGLFVRWLAK